VRAAVADEGDVLAVRRPLGGDCVAADRGEFLGLLLAVDRRDPELLFSGPEGLFAVGRDLDVFAAFVGTSHFAERTRFGVLGVDIEGEHLLLGTLRPTFGIGTLLVAVEFAA